MPQNPSKPDEKPLKPRGSRTIATTEPPMSIAELIERGQRAADLMGQTVYNLAYQSLVRQLQDDWVAAPTLEKREAIWSQIQGIGRVQQELASFVIEAKALSEKALLDEEANVVAIRESAGFA